MLLTISSVTMFGPEKPRKMSAPTSASFKVPVLRSRFVTSSISFCAQLRSFEFSFMMPSRLQSVKFLKP